MISVANDIPIVRPRLGELVEFLAQRLGAADYEKAVDLLRCTLDGVHSARRHREAAASGANA